MRQPRWTAAVAVGLVLIAGVVWFLGNEATISPATDSSTIGDPPTSFLSLDPVTLSPSRTIGTSESFGNLAELSLVDDTLVLVDRRPLGGEDKLLVVSLDSGEVVGRAGPPGQGPGDIMDAISVSTIPGRRSHFSIYDYVNRQVAVYSLDSWTGTPERTFRHHDGRNLWEVDWLSENRIVGTGFIADELLRFYEIVMGPEGQGMAYRGGVTEMLFDDPSPTVAKNLNWNALAVDGSTSSIVLAFRWASRIHVYNYDGRLRRVIAGPYEIEPQYVSESGNFYADTANGARQAYVDVVATQRGVYGLYSGTPEPMFAAGTEIHAFSWEGGLLGVFRLSEPISRLAVDSSGAHAYGIRKEPFSVVLEYELPDRGAEVASELGDAR